MVKKSKKNVPLVSIVVITYNHHKYIGQLLDSIVSQKRELPIEIIIGDDASVDDTKDHILDKKDVYEKVENLEIIPIFRSQNIGMTKNFIETLKITRGKFVAFAEGDDIWLDERKLEKQLKIINEGFGVSISDCAVLSSDGTRIGQFSRHRAAIDGKASGEISSKELISSPLRAWHLSSAMICRDCLPKELDWLLPFPIFDYGFFALTVDGCTVHYSNEELAGYRKHTSSVTAGRPFNYSYLLAMDKMLRQLASKIPDKKLAIRKKRLSNFYFFLKYCFPYRRSLLSIATTPLLLSLNKWSPYSLRDELYLLKRAWSRDKDH